MELYDLLAGSSVVISRVTIVISPIGGLTPLLITTHEPPSMVRGLGLKQLCRALLAEGLAIFQFLVHGGSLSRFRV